MRVTLVEAVGGKCDSKGKGLIVVGEEALRQVEGATVSDHVFDGALGHSMSVVSRLDGAVGQRERTSLRWSFLGELAAQGSSSFAKNGLEGAGRMDRQMASSGALPEIRLNNAVWLTFVDLTYSAS